MALWNAAHKLLPNHTHHHNWPFTKIVCICNPLKKSLNNKAAKHGTLEGVCRHVVLILFWRVTVFWFPKGREHVNAFGQRQTSKKRRKSRTAFTNHQIYELEKRFLYQKYLSPADRDQIAQQLGLTNAQVITWFQNRRAKLKRDLEEMKADVESLKKVPPQTLQKLVNMEDIDDLQGSSGAISPSISPSSQGHGAFPQSPSSSRDQTTDEFSEEDEEIEVDD